MGDGDEEEILSESHGCRESAVCSENKGSNLQHWVRGKSESVRGMFLRGSPPHPASSSVFSLISFCAPLARSLQRLRFSGRSSTKDTPLTTWPLSRLFPLLYVFA